MRKIEDNSLYLVISEECSMGRSAVEIAKSAIAGGVDLIQMREKKKSDKELRSLGSELSRLCKKSGVLFIVNDDPALARDVDADGVHLGQEDIARYSIDASRGILGRDRIIGISTHSIEEFTAANDSGADYAAYGPVFPTKTKDYSIGPGDVATVVKLAKKPVFFIGGIDLVNLGEILSRGAKNIALIRGILEAQDVLLRTSEFKQALCERKYGKAIIVKINGRNETIEESTSVLGLVLAKGLTAGRIVVEHNLRIVPREEWRHIALKENDSVEILNFMGGG